MLRGDGVRVVLLTYHYPPDAEVGGLRARKVAESFRERGDSVVVIAAAGPDQPPDAGDEGIRVIRVRPGAGLRGLYHRLRRSPGGASADETQPAGADAADGAAWTPPDHVSFLRRHVSAAMWLPDDRQGWIRPAARTAIRLARNGVDLIYSTAPPFSAHLAALLAHRRTGVRWVAEFRDPWTGNPWKPAFVRTVWSDALERRLERACLRAADRVVAVTDATAAHFRARLPDRERERVIVVRNGIDALETEPSTQSVVRNVVYVGSLYQKRDPIPFLAVVARMNADGALPPGFHVDFIGDCRWFHGRSIEEWVNEHGLGGVVRFAGRLPHEACIERVSDADLLLLLAQDQPLQVPNKLYEYLGARRRILAFADAGGETARMLETVGGHYVVDGDDAALVERVVHASISEPLDGVPVGPEATLREWTTERQLESLHRNLRMNGR